MPTTLAIFPSTPLVPYTPTLRDPAIVAEFSGSPLSARASTLERAYRRFAFRVRLRGTTERAAFADFWVARRGPVGLFYFLDRVEYARVSVALGVAVAAQVDFLVPTGATTGGDFPVADANAILYADTGGGPAVVAKTVDTDGRKFVASAAPGAGAIMTASYWYYRRVRFEGDEQPIPHPIVGSHEADVALVEEST